MKALTIWQPWAALIMALAKPYEFRRWPTPRSLIGQRVVIHAGARPVRPGEIADLINRLSSGEEEGTGLKVGPSLDLLEGWQRGKVTLLTGVGLGTAMLGTPRRVTDLFRDTVADSTRLDEHVWAWPVNGIEPFPAPIPAKGAQGFWEWRAR